MSDMMAAEEEGEGEDEDVVMDDLENESLSVGTEEKRRRREE